MRKKKKKSKDHYGDKMWPLFDTKQRRCWGRRYLEEKNKKIKVQKAISNDKCGNYLVQNNDDPKSGR
jgi:hypothetical protein